jgi:hypothetical protein
MKHNIFLSFACLLLTAIGCQSIQMSSSADKTGVLLTPPPAMENAELIRLPPVSEVKLVANDTGEQGGMVQQAGYPQVLNKAFVDMNKSLSIRGKIRESTPNDPFRLWDSLDDDAAHFYTWNNVLSTSGMLAFGAALAHSDLDLKFSDAWRDEVRSPSGDDVSKVGKVLGEGKYVIPSCLAAVGVGYLMPNTLGSSVLGEWGQRTTRSLIVGVPALLILQNATGGSRPRDSLNADWHPFADDHGVSGHAFIGAVPFICAAQITENRLAAASLYACAGMAGVSRINDDAHYVSQVILGWWLANLACSSVNRTEDDHQLQLSPIPTANGLGIGIQRQY